MGSSPGETGGDDRFRVATPPPRPLLIFDGDCGFCRMWVARWEAMTGERVDYEPSQQEAANYPEIPPELFARSVVFVRPDGSATLGAEAVFAALAEAPGRGGPLAAYRSVPGVAPVTEAAYSLVARNRVLFSRLTRLVWGRSLETPRFRIGTALMLRGVAVVYLIAFASLWMQAQGLIGSRGILPAAPFLDAVRAQVGSARFWLLPTVFWLSCSDAALGFVCALGVALALAAALGLAQRYCFVLLWAGYLSLATVARVFLGYQWDGLLLEAGLLAILLAPGDLRPLSLAAWDPPRAGVIAAKFLLFRLMFASGVVKLSSGDPNWRNLTALAWHYETQPLPNPLSWYLHQLPLAAHKAVCLATFAIELGAPFLIFAPGRLRRIAFVALAGLQLGFGLTGNYGFFNLLTIALCLPLLEDSWWRREGGAPRRVLGNPLGPGLGRDFNLGPARAGAAWRRCVVVPIATVVFLVGTFHLVGSFRTRIPWPRPVVFLVQAISPLRSINSYGLFAVMTTTRPEILVEGSRDGTTWVPYEFRWKPGDPDRPPPWAGPYMPRLDWQMWFAALDDFRSASWTQGLFARLLEGEPGVLALLGRNPFPEAPPRYVRAVAYDYRFTEPASRETSAPAGSPPTDTEAGVFPKLRGRWWTRRETGLWSPMLSLGEPRNQNPR